MQGRGEAGRKGGRGRGVAAGSFCLLEGLGWDTQECANQAAALPPPLPHRLLSALGDPTENNQVSLSESGRAQTFPSATGIPAKLLGENHELLFAVVPP